MNKREPKWPHPHVGEPCLTADGFAIFPRAKLWDVVTRDYGKTWNVKKTPRVVDEIVWCGFKPAVGFVDSPQEHELTMHTLFAKKSNAQKTARAWTKKARNDKE